MKKWCLPILGLLPLATGLMMNGYIVAFMDGAMPFKTIGLLCLGCWFVLGGLVTRDAAKPLLDAALLHLPGAVCLLLILWQELVLGQYMSNALGVLPQLFFLPFVNIASGLTRFFNRFYVVFIFSFVLMLLACYLGYRVSKQGERARRRTQ